MSFAAVKAMNHSEKRENQQNGSPAFSSLWIFWAVGLPLIAVDQLTKWWARTALAGGTTVRIIPHVVQFRLLFNHGATLGFASGKTSLIALFALIVSIGLVIASVKTHSRVWQVALGIGFAGAVGNLIDRIVWAPHFLDGPVTDFIDYGWSVGNIADIFLDIAVVMIVILLFSSVSFSGTAKGDEEK